MLVVMGVGYNFASDIQTESVLEQYIDAKTVSIIARVIRNLFESKDNGFCVYETETMDYRRFTVTGSFIIPLAIDNYYEFTGAVVNRNGELNLSVKAYKVVLPQNKEDVINVLRTLKGLDTKSHIVYDCLGSDALYTIRDSPETVVKKVKGVGIKRALHWQGQIRSNEQENGVISALLEYNIPMSKSKQLYERFGPSICDELKTNPYFLANNAGLLSFQECEDIALENGYPLDGLERVTGAMLHVLKEAAGRDKDCYLSETDFFDRALDCLGIYLTYKEAVSLVKNSTGDTYTYLKYKQSFSVDVDNVKAAIESCTRKTKFKYAIYKIPDGTIRQALDILLNNSSIIFETLGEEPVYYLYKYYNAENSVATYVRNIQNAIMPFSVESTPYIEAYCKKLDIELEDKQLQAVDLFTQTKGGFFILNGAAGSGKTFTLNIILKVLRSMYYAEGGQFMAKLLAPTGKAAKVAHNATGLPAFTIHKELGIVKEDILSPVMDVKNIDVDCLIVDEFSMVDIILASRLLEAVKPTTKVIILGDTEQLPSIGPGMVLQSMIDSKQISLVTLNVIKRQSEESGILTNANKILKGKEIAQETPNEYGIEDNAYITYTNTEDECQSEIVDTIKYLIGGEGFNIEDIQILCPQRKTNLGTEAINLLIQKVITPGFDESKAIPSMTVDYKANGKAINEVLYFKEGDKVIHTRNNYQMVWYELDCQNNIVQNYTKTGIINGEMGIVYKVEVTEGTKEKTNRMWVKYDEGFVLYQNNFSEIEHAYALTIHKSQGSQWPIIISPVMDCNSRMLTRKLLYTMYTRAQVSVFVLGTQKTLEKAVKRNPNALRNSSLTYRLVNHPQYPT